jgi:hypothetical protein
MAAAAEADAYKDLLAGVVPLSIADAVQGGEARLLSLDGRWFRCTVTNRTGKLLIDNLDDKMVGAMFGSPIVCHDRSAIGVLCNATDENDEPQVASPQPSLADQLPGWLLGAISRGAPRFAYDLDQPVFQTAAKPIAPVIDDSPEAGIAELKGQLALGQDRRAATRGAR